MNEPTQAELDAAQTLIPCNCGTKTHKHMTDCPRHGIAWEDVADALHTRINNEVDRMLEERGQA